MNGSLRSAAFGSALLAIVAFGGPPAVAATTVDSDFVTAVARSNANERDLARLELARGRSDEARSFANRMLEDHAPLEAELVALAPEGTRHVEPSAQDRLVRARLTHLTSTDFDQQYVLTQVAGHLEAVTACETEIAGGRDARLQAYARAALPTIREHLAVAIAATKHIGGDTPFKGAQ